MAKFTGTKLIFEAKLQVINERLEKCLLNLLPSIVEYIFLAEEVHLAKK